MLESRRLFAGDMRFPGVIPQERAMKVLACDGIQESSRVPIHDDGLDVAVFVPIKDPDALAFGLDAPSGQCATAISMSLETL